MGTHGRRDIGITANTTATATATCGSTVIGSPSGTAITTSHIAGFNAMATGTTNAAVGTGMVMASATVMTAILIILTGVKVI